MSNETTKVKLRKVLPSGLPEELEALGPDELRAAIAAASFSVWEAEEFLTSNEQLLELKRALDEAKASAAEAKKVQRAKQRYAAILLEERGQ